MRGSRIGIIPATTLLILSIFLFFSCSQKKLAVPAVSKIVMDTVCTVNVYSDGTKELYDEIFSRLFAIENIFSATIDSSDVSKVNKASGEKSVLVSSEMIYVLETALKIAKLSNGAFNPVANPLIELWGINTDHAKVPTSAEIEGVLPFLDFNDIKIEGQNVFLCKKGMGINLGGIVKGYAADCIVEILKNHSVKQAIIDLGGNIYVYGEKKDGKKWNVGIKNPFEESAEPILKLSVLSTSVVTSGIYQRFFEKDGKRYHHIFDTKTGFPASTGLVSVTTVAPSSIIADALSTTAFVLGEEKTLLLKNIFEETFKIPIDFIFINEDKSISYSGEKNCNSHCDW